MSPEPQRPFHAPDPLVASDEGAAQASASLASGPPVPWQALLGRLGRDLAEPLTAALERVTTLASTGRIDHAGLRALREEVDRARQAGIRCQQIARMAAGRIRQSHERVHLTNTVQSVLAYRARELQTRQLQLSQSLMPLEIQVDASMLFGLLDGLVDWWLDCAEGGVELRVQTSTWPAHAQLHCTFRMKASAFATEGGGDSEPTQQLDTLAWHLLAQTAQSMGLMVERTVNGRDPAQRVTLTLTFPGTVQAVLTDGAAIGSDKGFSDSVNSKPLAGSHVLVIAAQRDIRLAAREALKSMGLVLDFVGSVREAAEFCREGLPHAVVFEGALRSTSFERLVAEIRKEVPEFVFIEVTEEGRTLDLAGTSGSGMTRVGRDGIASALPSALVYELSRVM